MLYNTRFFTIVFSIVFTVFSNDSLNNKTTPSSLHVNKTEMASNDTVTVIARLVEIPGTMPPNDLYNYVYIMKYRVLSVIKGKYTEKEIYVGHYNPLSPRKSIKGQMDPMVNGNIEKFTVGAKHRLTLISPIEKVWKDAVEDEYIETELNKFFAIVADELK